MYDAQRAHMLLYFFATVVGSGENLQIRAGNAVLIASMRISRVKE
jgi:hypothetical protein